MDAIDFEQARSNTWTSGSLDTSRDASRAYVELVMRSKRAAIRCVSSIWTQQIKVLDIIFLLTAEGTS
jgi:hypothetical protein